MTHGSAETPAVVEAVPSLDPFVTWVASELLSARDDDLDGRIEQVLGRLAPAVGAARAYLVEDAPPYTVTHGWATAAASAPPVAQDLEGFPSLRRRFDEAGLVRLERREELPREAALEARALEGRGVGALLLLPLDTSQRRHGILGFEAPAPRAWIDAHVEALRVVAGLLAAAFDRRRATAALRAAEARQRAILEALPDFVFVLTADGVIRDVHAPADLSLSIEPAQLVGARITRLVPERVAEMVLARLSSVLETLEPQTLQYMLPTGDTRRYLEVRFAPREKDQVLALVRDISDRKEAEKRLEEQERLYEILVQSTLDAVVLSDKDGAVLSWNPGAERMFGFTAEQIVGQPLSRLVPDFDTSGPTEVDLFIRSGKSGMLNRVVEMWGQRRDGQAFPAEVTLSVWASSGEIFLASVIRDITERRRAETRLRDSEQRYKQLVQNSADGILLHDEQGRLVDVNHRTVEMLGYSREELLCLTVPQIEKDTLPEVHKQVWSRMGPEQAMTMEGTYERRDGTQFPVEMRLAKFLGSTQEGARILVIARDATERKAAEGVMLEHQTQLRHLASQLTLTEESQRRELAVQLHDGIGQELAMARLRLQTYQSAPPAEQDPQHLATAVRYVEQAIGRVQSLTFDLSPPALHELGLPAALRSLGRRIQADHGLDFEYEQVGEDAPLAKELEVLLFRTVRELAINVVKHAQATRLRVTLHTSLSEVEIAVEDDGVGMDPDLLQARTSPHLGGFGLFSVRERLGSMQGSLEIQNREGTIATIVVPISERTPYAYLLGGSTP